MSIVSYLSLCGDNSYVSSHQSRFSWFIFMYLFRNVTCMVGIEEISSVPLGAVIKINLGDKMTSSEA